MARRGCNFVVLILAQLMMSRAVDVPEYWPEIGDDLGAVTWAHGVNNQAFLEESLTSEVMMLEADVSLGWVGDRPGLPQNRIPIMAHPPAVTSDLTLSNFLASVVAATSGEDAIKKGIKLDFKSVDVLNPSLTELEAIKDQITFPVWLNADILPGPVNSTDKPVDAQSFLAQCKTRFPTSTLSTGWKTRFGVQSNGENISQGIYTNEQVDEMTASLNEAGITQPVTFPVRAGIAAHSGTELTRLLHDTPGSTLTLWSPESDPVDVPALLEVLEEVGRQNVYIDVPEDLRDALNGTPRQVGLGSPHLPVGMAMALTLASALRSQNASS